MFRSVIYLIVFLFTISFFYSCSGGGCSGFELIPNGYRVESNNYPMLQKSAQLRITNNAFNFVEGNIDKIIALAGQEYVMEPDASGNPRIKFNMVPVYGRQSTGIGGIDYGICSQCDDSEYNICRDTQAQCTGTPDEDSCGINVIKEINGGTVAGCEIIMTIDKSRFQITGIDESSTEADILHATGNIMVDRTGGNALPAFVDSSFMGGHTNCDIDFSGNIPLSVDVDFVLNTKSETSIKILNLDLALENNITIEPNCNWAIDVLIGLVKGIVIEQIQTTIEEQVASITDTLLCARCVPDYENNAMDSYHCPVNSPAGSYCGNGCSTSTDCTEGSCIGGYCVVDSDCNAANPCATGYNCDIETGYCVLAPYCMTNTDVCWEQQLGFEGRIDTTSLLKTLIPSTNQSWLNFYVNAGGYAKAQNDGISFGVFGGTKGEWNKCVSPSNKTFDLQVPELDALGQNSFGTNNTPYQVGIGVSEYFVNQALTNMYESGVLCLDVDSDVSEFLTTSTFSLLIPSLNDLTEKENNSVMISIRPKKTPIIEIGDGTVDAEGNPLIDQALLNLAIDDLQIDIYAFVEERYVRALSVTTDLRVGINLDVDEQHRLIPVLSPLKMGDAENIRNIRITNNYILRESAETLLNTLPAVIELALGMLPLSFEPIALPSIMGFGMDILDIKREQQGTGEVADFFAIYGNLSIAEPVRRVSIRNINTANMVIPPLKSIGKEKPVVVMNIETDSSENIEYQYRLNNGFWSPFKKGNVVQLDRLSLMLYGKHKVDIRVREVKKPKTLSQIFTKTITVDKVSPQISLALNDGKVNITAKDNVTENKNLLFSYNIDGKGWTTYSNNNNIQLPQNKSFLLEAKVKDELGNESYTKKRYNLDKVIKTDSTVQATGCSYGNSSGGSFILFGLIMVTILFRKYFLYLFVLLAMFLAGCGDNPASGKCVVKSDCPEGNICENNKCVEKTDCNENPYAYECSECYIPERCDASNPCNQGCECIEITGKCEKIEGYCNNNDDCETGKECKNNQCTTTRCNNDNDCATKDCSANGDYSNPFCDTVTGACLCSVPCGGQCPDDKFCCHDVTVDACLTKPAACSDFTCDAGYEIIVLNEGSLNDVTCKLENVQCECKELPHLKLGTIGKNATTKIWNDKIVIAGYNSTYGDLVFGIYDENVNTIDGEHITWYFIDGVPEAEVTNGPTGPRGGISELGDDVGSYSSMAIDSLNRIHISYYDKTNDNLKYALLTPIDTESFGFTKTIINVDTEGITGLFTSITTGSDNKPAITYMTKEISQNNKYFTNMKIAIANTENPVDVSSWTIKTLDESEMEIPCNRSCGENQKCMFDEEAVSVCKTDFVTSTHSATGLPLNIPDNNPQGVISSITIPVGTGCTEFRLNANITHTYRGDISIKLIGPDSREYVIINSNNEDNGINLAITGKIISQLANKDVSGNWKLLVTDTANQDTGTLNSWSIKLNSLRDNSPYCGAECMPLTEDCSSCSLGTVCSEGVCNKEAKEYDINKYFKGVGLFAKSQRYSAPNALGITYYDSIKGELKYIIYNLLTQSPTESVILASSNSGRNVSLNIIGDVANVSYIDGASHLRYLTYQQGQTSVISSLIDDGIRTENSQFDVHQIGADSVIYPTGSGMELYYMDATTHDILKRNYVNAQWESVEIFKSHIEQQVYKGSFGFYLNILKHGNVKVATTFYYKLQVEGGTEEQKPDSSGKIKVIK